MNKLFSIFLIFIFILKIRNKTVIKNNLNIEAPTIEALERRIKLANPKEETRRNPDAILDDKTNLLNLKIIAEAILNGQKPIAKGEFGSVYKIDGRVSFENKRTMQMAVKEVLIDDDYNTENGITEQDRLDLELQILENLQATDPKNHFFAKFYGAGDLTTYLPSLSEPFFPAKIKRALAKVPGKERFFLFTEFLKNEVFDYFVGMNEGKETCGLHTRLRMAINVGKGLQELHKSYFHCDIKPENLMFKHTLQIKLRKLEEIGIKRLELIPGKDFQVKIIDFGLAAQGELPNRKCSQGTPGFIPRDVLLKKPHDKYDVYSLAMTMLDFEFAEQQMLFYSRVQAEIFNARSSKNTMFTDEQVDELESQPLVKFVMKISKKSPYKEMLYAKIHEKYPGIEKSLSDLFKKPLIKVSIKNYMFSHVSLFEFIMQTAAEMYWNNIYVEKTHALEVAKWDEQIEEQTRILKVFWKGTELYQILDEKLEMLKAQKRLAEGQMEHRLKLVNFYLKCVHSRYKKRPNLQKFVEFVTKLDEEYELQFQADLKNIFDYNKFYKRDKLEFKETSLKTKNDKSKDHFLL